MIKECLVTLNNEVITVVKYDNKYIQFPSIQKDVKKIFVDYTNGKYTIVKEKCKTDDVYKARKKNNIKKTDIEESVMNTDLKDYVSVTI